MKDWEKVLEYMPTSYLFAIKTTIEKIIIGETSNLDIKLLSGEKNMYRCRVGKYRIIYSIENGEITIRKIGCRGDIYK